MGKKAENDKHAPRKRMRERRIKGVIKAAEGGGGDYGYFSFAASSQTNKPIIEQLIFKELVFLLTKKTSRERREL